ncbi:MAG: HlyC/CorC family transporter [Kiritimatiellae bacterium]|nr:HlyC/CorC family transporter [Kiritimatiellia bacterium]
MSTVALLLLFVAIVILFAFSAFFSGSETVLFSLSPVQIQRIKRRTPAVGARIEKQVRAQSSTLSTILVANSFVNFAIAGIGYRIFESISGYGEALTVPVITLLLLLIGEITPKRIAVENAERYAPFCSNCLSFWFWIFRPFSFVMEASNLFFKKFLSPERQILNDDEFRTAIQLSERQGELDEDEASMVDGIMRLSELRVSDEMIPRIDMIGIDLEDAPETFEQTARASGHRYLPVYRHTPDAVEGFLDVVQFLTSPHEPMRAAVKPAMFIPENLSLDKLLIRFQKQGKHIACVLDEYGGTAGIITLGDIQELITDPVVRPEGETEDIRPLSKDSWLLTGTAGIEEINHEAEIDLEADDSDRISGWITLHAGRIPEPGMVITAQGCRATVLAMRKRRITQVRLDVLKRKGLDEAQLDEIVNDEDNLVDAPPSEQPQQTEENR